jgi:hypothetical protein
MATALESGYMTEVKKGQRGFVAFNLSLPIIVINYSRDPS